MKSTIHPGNTKFPWEWHHFTFISYILMVTEYVDETPFWKSHCVNESRWWIPESTQENIAYDPDFFAGSLHLSTWSQHIRIDLLIRFVSTVMAIIWRLTGIRQSITYLFCISNNLFIYLVNEKQIECNSNRFLRQE